MTTIGAGELRHRVRIDQRVTTQDTNSDTVSEWVPWAVKVPASIEPLSVRELMAAQAVQSKVTARIKLRYRPGLLATMRIVHGSTIYNMAGALPDKNSGIEYVTIPVEAGTNDG